MLRQVEEDRDLSESALRTERRKVKALQRELANKMILNPKAQAAHALFEYWRRCCRPKAREFGTSRMKAVMGRLDGGHSPADIAIAIEGAAVFAYRKDGVRYDDIELICRSAEQTQKFMDKGRLARANILTELPSMRSMLIARMGEEKGEAEFLDLAELAERFEGYGPSMGDTH